MAKVYEQIQSGVFLIDGASMIEEAKMGGFESDVPAGYAFYIWADAVEGFDSKEEALASLQG